MCLIFQNSTNFERTFTVHCCCNCCCCCFLDTWQEISNLLSHVVVHTNFRVNCPTETEHHVLRPEVLIIWWRWLLWLQLSFLHTLFEVFIFAWSLLNQYGWRKSQKRLALFNLKDIFLKLLFAKVTFLRKFDRSIPKPTI